jgi:ASC-1-like (ASCH) protein
MQHIAIMKKRIGSIEDILKGKKTIESRWYVHKTTPWNKVKKGETIFFKESGGYVYGKAIADKVLQFENYNERIFKEIVKEYGDMIGMKDRNYYPYYASKNHCILILLSNPKRIKEFKVNKKGFGSACAWMCVEDIKRVIV